MKLMVLCEHCKKYYEIQSKNVGHTVRGDSCNFNLRYKINWTITNLTELEEMSAIDEDDVKVDNFEVNFICPECGEYIIIESES